MSKIEVNQETAKPITLGRKSDGTLFQQTLKDMGSLLIGGLSGAGKTALLQNIANQACEQAQVFIIDAKRVGYLKFKGRENCHVITSMEKFPDLLQKLVQELNSRYTTMERANTDVCKAGRILMIIDEAAEAFYGLSDNEKDQIRQILSLGRQCNITIVLATQSPSRRLLSGAITDMFTTHCALRTSSVYASKIILEERGAERIPRFSAIFAGVNGFKTQVRLMPPLDQQEEDMYATHDKIEWEDD